MHVSASRGAAIGVCVNALGDAVVSALTTLCRQLGYSGMILGYERREGEMNRVNYSQLRLGSISSFVALKNMLQNGLVLSVSSQLKSPSLLV